MGVDGLAMRGSGISNQSVLQRVQQVQRHAEVVLVLRVDADILVGVEQLKVAQRRLQSYSVNRLPWQLGKCVVAAESLQQQLQWKGSDAIAIPCKHSQMHAQAAKCRVDSTEARIQVLAWRISPHHDRQRSVGGGQPFGGRRRRLLDLSHGPAGRR